MFERQVERSPEATAVVYEDEEISYGELNRRANRLAHYLRRNGVGPEVSVGICLNRDIDLVVAILGALKAGGAYVPLDPGYPAERIRFMMEDGQIGILLTRERLTMPFMGEKAKVIRLDLESEIIAAESCQNPVSEGMMESLAYIIYTSGSTGLPKGVTISHKSVNRFLNWARDNFTQKELSGVLVSTSICFDLSIFELFAPLVSGGTVILVENLLHLSGLPSADKVTLINTVPSAMTEIIRMNGTPKSVTTVNLAGEPIKNKLVKRIYGLKHVERVFNLYGPSEDTTYSTVALLDVEDENDPVIGKPITNTRIYLLTDFLRPVPVGVAGGLYIGGEGLARGYFNRPDLTADRFRPDPYGQEGGGRIYQTGDRARYLPDGNIEFLGRLDHQVKVRGYRIELGEIEAVLSDHPEVREAIVAIREDAQGEKRIVGYVVQERETLTSVDLRNYLKQRLPDYLVPNIIMSLDAMPLTPNGKINRSALPNLDNIRPQSPASYVHPQTDLERAIADIWRMVLGRTEIGVDDNFFDLGGHSLLLVQAHSELLKIVDWEFSVIELFRYPTISLLCGYLNKKNSHGTAFTGLHDRAVKQRETIKRQKHRLRRDMQS